MSTINDTEFEGTPSMPTSSDIIPPMELQVAYTVLEILVAIVAVIGNAMVILVFWRERRLRRRTNYYIVSLAVADLLVGLLGIPFAIMASVGLPTNLHACLFTVSLLIVLCTISIFCLVAVSVDRYWAILHPMGYSKNVRTKTAIIIISLCWVAGSVIGFLPLFGWHAGTSEHISCFFVKVMDYDFLVFLYFATIITPSLVLAAFYAHIYTVVVRQLRQIVTMNPNGNGLRGTNNQNGGTMLRVLGAAQKREVKATQNLSIIVLFFIICWIPLYTINCVKAFCPDCYIEATWTDFCIILSHLNSAVNPLLYAYHLRDFRAALKSLIYKMLGITDTNPINDTYYKPSIISQNHRRQSHMESRPSLIHNNQPKIYVDSPIWLRQRAAEMTNNSPGIPSVSGAASTISTDSTLLTNLPQMSNSPETTQRREIWMITEVPSVSEERDMTDESSDVAVQRNIMKHALDPLSDEYDDDDEVFLPAVTKNLEVIQYDFKNGNTYCTDLPFRDKEKLNRTCSDNSDDFSSIVVNSTKFNSDSQNSRQNSSCDNDRNSFCSNSPSHKIFFVENSSNEILKTSPSLSNNSKNAKDSKLERKHSTSVSSDYSCSPTKSLRLSPLKIVGEFLFNQSTKKCTSQNKNSKVKKKNKYVLPKESTEDVFQYLDLQKNGVIPKYKVTDNFENR